MNDGAAASLGVPAGATAVPALEDLVAELRDVLGPGGIEVRGDVAGLAPGLPVRCLVAADATGATFRFHRVRPGERWESRDLNAYLNEKVVVIESSPPAGSSPGTR